MDARSYLLRRRRRAAANGNGGHGGPIAISAGMMLMVFMIGLLGTGGVGLGVYAFVAKDLVPIETIQSRETPKSTTILDRNGKLLYELFDPQFGRRTNVPLKDISPYLIQATIATEDNSFYENQGFDPKGIIRAFVDNITSGEVVGGGSSITQQLAKNVFIPEEERTQVSILRKIKEVILSVELTRRYSKDQILEWYLNENNYGNLSYGIEAASQSYFSKPARDLNLAEASLLAGIPQQPARFSPITNPDGAERRQDEVLDLMMRQGFVSEAEANEAREQKLTYKQASFEIKAPHFVMYVREQLAERYGARALYRTGLKVTTSLDLDLQTIAEEAITRQVAITARNINAHNAALVAIDPHTGEILTMVGSADYFNAEIDGQVNVALSERQPGSSFKPYTYVTAFAKGWSPSTILFDTPYIVNDGFNPPHEVRNVDRTYRGPVTIRTALSNSMNIPAMRAIAFTGIEPVIETAHKMGITTLNRKGWYGPTLTLGAGEVKLLDHTFGYAVFANQGKMAGIPVPPEKQQAGHRTLDPVSILRVVDDTGKVWESFDGPSEKQIISPELAYEITSILSDRAARAPIFGSTLDLAGGRPAAIKTGTTEEMRDFWQMGYTPDLAVGVWLGNADPRMRLTGGLSSTTAGPIWKEFVNRALEGQPHAQFPAPAGILTQSICVSTGVLADKDCPLSRSEIFTRDQVPRDKSAQYVTIAIDKVTGLRAGPSTPPEDIEQRTYLIVPDDAKKWAEENNIPQPPAEVSVRTTPTPAAPPSGQSGTPTATPRPTTPGPVPTQPAATPTPVTAPTQPPQPTQPPAPTATQPSGQPPPATATPRPATT